MNSEIYSTVIPAAPFIIGAYGLIWVTFVVIVGLVIRRVGKLEKELSVLEDSMKRRSGAES